MVEAEKMNNFPAMSYSYYHKVIKGASPKTAPTYIEEKVADVKEQKPTNKSKKYKCSICGYVYDDEKEKIKFEDLPDDWTCPMCGVGKDLFVEVE